ncbi:MAG: hypothetical protein LAP85_19180 [Acidobacteriia bacterium]|nr:hypothetical protein [Terriglobia bacterium]
MKTKTLLIAAVIFVVISAAAFAQNTATFSVGSIPVTTVINTGQAERTGDVTFTQVSGTSAAGTITINYGVPITSPDLQTAGQTLLTKSSAGYIGAGVTVSTASNNALGLLVITVPGGVAAGNVIIVSGIRVAIAGTSLTSLSVTLTTTGNAIVAGETSALVISSIAAGISAIAVPDGGSPPITVAVPGKINAVTGAVDVATAVITIKEGFLQAWTDRTINGQGATTGVGVRITVDAPPKGVTYTFPNLLATTNAASGAAVGSQFQRGDSTGSLVTSTTTLSSSSNSFSVFYYCASDIGDSVLELLPISVAIASDPTQETLPLASVVLNYKVSLAPTGNAFNNDGSIITNRVPRFLATDLGPAPFVIIAGRLTALLMPYATFGSGFDTGIAISNTTQDPGAAVMGTTTAATPQSGTITFYFFPQGTATHPNPYTTVGTSPGSGLDSSGNVISGSTYVVLLSQLLTATGTPGPFNGYVIAVTNFSNGHGIFVLSNFVTFGQSALMQVLSNRAFLPEITGN